MGDFIVWIIFSHERASEGFVTQELMPYDVVYAKP
jgi:hypothetical protein